jgi:hypothetical protein
LGTTVINEHLIQKDKRRLNLGNVCYQSVWEYGMRMFQNRVLEKIFGLKGDEMAGGWRKLQNKGFITFTLYLI